VYFWSLLEYVTSHTAPASDVLSSLTPIQYVPCIYRTSVFLWEYIQDQEAQYNLLLSLQADLLLFIKDGLSARDVYQHALNYVKANMPDLEKYFVKNIGFAVSLPFAFD